MGLIEKLRRKEEDLGGTPSSPDDPKDTWAISRKLKEQRLGGNVLSQDPNEILGDDPGGHDGSVPGIIFRSKKYERVPRTIKRLARENGKDAAILTGIFVLGTLFVIGHKDEIKKLKKLWKK